LLRARFVARLFLSALVAHDALIIASGWMRFGFRHALLAAMFAAPILRTCQIVFLWHRSQTLSSFADETALNFSRSSGAS
jgi:hypothetical protein